MANGEDARDGMGEGCPTEGPRRKPCCRRRGGGGGALVEPAALAALLYQSGYGYDMRRSILDHTEGALDVDVGGLYRALRRLEEEGSVESRWGDEESGPRRREYRITDQGVDQANQWLDALRQRQRLDGLIIGLLEDGLARRGGESGSAAAVGSDAVDEAEAEAAGAPGEATG